MKIISVDQRPLAVSFHPMKPDDGFDDLTPAERADFDAEVADGWADFQDEQGLPRTVASLDEEIAKLDARLAYKRAAMRELLEHCDGGWNPPLAGLKAEITTLARRRADFLAQRESLN
jgi:hypothetical protein